MKIIESINEMVLFCAAQDEKSSGFVPTMGAIHEGHLSLVRESKKNNDITIVSIYVNPAQFGPYDDFKNYPRNEKKDKLLLEAEGVDVLFLPKTAEIYLPDRVTHVAVDEAFVSRACGAFRPNHFEGVATVVLKLFNIVKSTKAYFGLKDYQQFILIKKIVSDFNLSVLVVGLPTVRESDGLAMSSRNEKLSANNRALAPAIYKNLTLIKDQLLVTQARGERFDLAEVFDRFSFELAKLSSAFRVQYLQVYDKDFNPINALSVGNAVMVAAVYLGDVRLIDNVEF